MEKPKVSFITPCNNGEKYLENFLSSLLEQEYNNVELFFVDDGSTDKTKDIFSSYIPRLEEKGWQVKYIYKENGGAASAINVALPLITGKYLIWPDSDDVLYPTSISERVKFLEEHPEYGIVSSPIDVVKENKPDIIVKIWGFPVDDEMFKHTLNEEHIIWTLGNMVRTEVLFDTIPNKKIPECQGGQNCQILMPIFYKYRCGYIDKPLAKYVVHSDSHSRTNQKKFLKRRMQMIEIWIKTILTLRYAGKFEKFNYILQVLFRNFIRIIKHYLSLIYSIKTTKERIIITILGVKIKFKKRHKRTTCLR